MVVFCCFSMALIGGGGGGGGGTRARVCVLVHLNTHVYPARSDHVMI